MITVLLVDDHRLVREALRDLLAKEPDIELVGEAGDAASALKGVDQLKPDVVVLDIGLPDMSGVEVAAKLRSRDRIGTKIVVLSVHTHHRFVAEMLRVGASGYVSKSSAWADLLHAIRAVAAGQDYVCPELAGTLVSALRNGSQDRKGPLTPREREVLRMVVDGTRSPSIAEQLDIALGTVEVHRRNIMRKTGLRTVAELTRYALREGLVVN